MLITPAPYDSEDVLQSALADYPQVIAGQSTDDVGGTHPLVLVAREIGIPGTAFSLDHLFLDAEGVPVLVEVKRASDTRIRREVVGQMLDYAANAAKNWPVSFLRDTVDKQAVAIDQSLEEYLASVSGDDVEQYWKQVEANLAAGRIRLLFVADELPDSLVRIIEFCNEQMNRAEVLGVEVRQYSADGHIAYVPRVIGRTSEAVAAKQTAGAGTRWTRESFLAETQTERCNPAVRTVVHCLLEHVDAKGMKLSWGSGKNPGVGGWYDLAGRPTGCWVLNLGDGTSSARTAFVLYLRDIVKHTTHEHLEKVAAHLETIPSMKPRLQEARANDWNKWPSIPLADLASDEHQVAALFAGLDALAESSATPTTGAGAES